MTLPCIQPCWSCSSALHLWMRRQWRQHDDRTWMRNERTRACDLECRPGRVPGRHDISVAEACAFACVCSQQTWPRLRVVNSRSVASLLPLIERCFLFMRNLNICCICDWPCWNPHVHLCFQMSLECVRVLMMWAESPLGAAEKSPRGPCTWLIPQAKMWQSHCGERRY